MFALNAFNVWVVGVFLYIISVSSGGEMIKIFSATTPTSTYSVLCLVGGLILVTWPFVDGLALIIKVWIREFGLSKKKEDKK